MPNEQVLSSQFVATIDINGSKTIQPKNDRGYNEGGERLIREGTKVVIRSRTLDGLKRKIHSVLAVMDEEDLA